MHSSAPLAISLSFVVIAVTVAALFVAGNAAAARRLGETASARRRLTLRIALATFAWMAATAAAAASGVLARFDARPPPFLLLMVATFAMALAVALSRVGSRLARGLPLAALVGVQAFRLPLELAMHVAARAGVMPERMSFTGANFDIVTGALAIPVALIVARSQGRSTPARVLVLAWNVVGFALLANVLVNAVLATPMIHAFGTDPRDLNTFVAYFPFVWLPAVLVAAALAGHVIVARKLLLHATSAAPSSSPSR
jgi:hypothetical protein